MNCVTPRNRPVLVSPFECRMQGDSHCISRRIVSYSGLSSSGSVVSGCSVFPGTKGGAECSANLELKDPMSLGILQPTVNLVGWCSLSEAVFHSHVPSETSKLTALMKSAVLQMSCTTPTWTHSAAL